MPTRRPISTALPLALEALGVALALATILLFRDCVVDDAYIGLRYAANLLAGHGLVYNPGEKVEGITNLAFTLGVAGLGGLGLDLLTIARALGLVGAAVAVWLAPCVVMPAPEQRLLRAVARLLCLGNFALVYLAWTGLETGAFAGLVTAAIYLQGRAGLRYTAAVGVLVGLAFATRPEGVLLLPLGLALAASRHGVREVLRGVGPWISLAIVGAVELSRWSYYGAWLPNTARVKGLLSTAAPSAVPWYGAFGDDFAEMFAQAGGAIALPLVAVALARAEPRGRVWLAAGVLACFAAFEIYSGGDWMLGYRYLQPAVPLYLALAVAGGGVLLRALTPALSSRWLALVLASVVVVALHGWSFGLRFRQSIAAYPQFVMTSRDMSTAARWLAERYPPHTTVTCWRIGALGYHSGLVVIDTNGLTDARVAETLADPPALEAYLAAREPDLMLLRGRPGEPGPAQVQQYGGDYRFVRDFDQGAFQTWRLYERTRGRTAASSLSP